MHFNVASYRIAALSTQCSCYSNVYRANTASYVATGLCRHKCGRKRIWSTGIYSVDLGWHVPNTCATNDCPVTSSMPSSTTDSTLLSSSQIQRKTTSARAAGSSGTMPKSQSLMFASLHSLNDHARGGCMASSQLHMHVSLKRKQKRKAVSRTRSSMRMMRCVMYTESTHNTRGSTHTHDTC